MQVFPIDELRLIVRQAQGRNAELAQVLDTAGLRVLEHIGYTGQVVWGNAAVHPDGSQSRDLCVDVAGVIVALRIRAAWHGLEKCVEVGGVSYRMVDLSIFAQAANQELERLLRVAVCMPL
jgi:hypothetical protein